MHEYVLSLTKIETFKKMLKLFKTQIKLKTERKINTIFLLQNQS